MFCNNNTHATHTNIMHLYLRLCLTSILDFFFFFLSDSCLKVFFACILVFFFPPVAQHRIATRQKKRSTLFGCMHARMCCLDVCMLECVVWMHSCLHNIFVSTTSCLHNIRDINPLPYFVPRIVFSSFPPPFLNAFLFPQHS